MFHVVMERSWRQRPANDYWLLDNMVSSCLFCQHTGKCVFIYLLHNWLCQYKLRSLNCIEIVQQLIFGLHNMKHNSYSTLKQIVPAFQSCFRVLTHWKIKQLTHVKWKWNKTSSSVFAWNNRYFISCCASRFTELMSVLSLKQLQLLVLWNRIFVTVVERNTMSYASEFKNTWPVASGTLQYQKSF